MGLTKPALASGSINSPTEPQMGMGHEKIANKRRSLVLIRVYSRKIFISVDLRSSAVG
jgi:hypothetical protein